MQTEPLKPAPGHGLRPGALLVSLALNVAGALAVLLALPKGASPDRIAAAWALVQFISGVWAGVLGANSPFLHGLVAGAPALVLGFAIRGVLPPQYVIVAWFLTPAAALLAAACMRFMRRRS